MFSLEKSRSASQRTTEVMRSMYRSVVDPWLTLKLCNKLREECKITAKEHMEGFLAIREEGKLITDCGRRQPESVAQEGNIQAVQHQQRQRKVTASARHTCWSAVSKCSVTGRSSAPEGKRTVHDTLAALGYFGLVPLVSIVSRRNGPLRASFIPCTALDFYL